MLQVVHADGAADLRRACRAALDAGLVDKVGFTGSTTVGRRIGELAGRHLQSACLELGGKNPLVVVADADLDLAVEGALFSGFGTAGQRCTSLGTAFVHETRVRRLRRAPGRRGAAAPVGEPTDDVLFGPLINEGYLATFEKHLDLVQPHHSRARLHRRRADHRRQPARRLRRRPRHRASTCTRRWSSGVAATDELYRVETFGPLVGVGVVRRRSTRRSSWPTGTATGSRRPIYTRDPATAFRFRERCSAGMVSVNNSTSGAEAHLPFGGNGLSGNGSRQSGIWVLDQFTRWQSMNWDYAGQLQKAQMDTPGLGDGPAGGLADSTYDADFRL